MVALWRIGCSRIASSPVAHAMNASLVVSRSCEAVSGVLIAALSVIENPPAGAPLEAHRRLTSRTGSSFAFESTCGSPLPSPDSNGYRSGRACTSLAQPEMAPFITQVDILGGDDDCFGKLGRNECNALGVSQNHVSRHDCGVVNPNWNVDSHQHAVLEHAGVGETVIP